MSVESPPRPVPRKRNVAPKSSSSSVTSSVTRDARTPSVSVSAKDLEVKGLRSKLDELSMQELRGILEDAAALHSFISSLSVPQLDSVQSNKENAATENRRLAEQNLEIKPEVEKLWNELTSVEATVQSLMDTYTQYYEQLPELVTKLDNQKILGQLQRSVNELESQTEEVAENFLAGRIDEDQFMDQYVKSRVSFWLRKVKAEKMEELVNPSAPNLPPKRSQPSKPSPYRTAGGVRGNTVQMPTPSHPTAPAPTPVTQPPPTQQQPYHQPPPPTHQPYRQPVPPVSAAVPAAPYPQPHPQYQPQRPQYQYPQQQRPPYQYPPRQPHYQQQPPRPYPAAAQAGYRPPAYPQQPRYPPQPGYQQPRPAGYYPYPQQYRYR